MTVEKDFIRIIRENEGIIFRITTIYARDEEEQKDLYQEIVYQLWKSFASFRHESKFSTWMYRIALNTSITYLRKERRKGNRVPIDQVVLNRMDHTDTETEERLSRLYAQIGKLNVIDKALILLHLEGKSYDEIAAITGFTAGNVGTRLNRVREKLRQMQNR
jgi:RNA polymerase sigma-70 factor (ECF subfamily)